MKYEIPTSISTEAGNSAILSRAFAKGCNGKLVKPIRQVNTLSTMRGANIGGVFPPLEKIATFGILRGCDAAMKAAKEYWHIDHSYFGEKGVYFRVTRNTSIHDGKGDHSWDRFSSFGIEFTPWKKNGNHIVICPPSVPQIKFLGIENWLDNTISSIKKHTDRKIVISQKSNSPKGFYENSKLAKDIPNLPIAEALKGAWVLITDHSNTMITALVGGVPIICTNSNRQIGQIENIEYPVYERKWLKNLAYNQWSLEEIKNGQAWQELNEWG